MATTSFNESFVVTNVEVAEKLLHAIENPEVIHVTEKNIQEEYKKTINALNIAFPI